MPGAAEDFRRIADELGAEGIRTIERGRLRREPETVVSERISGSPPEEPSSTADELAHLAHAGKAALEAAQMAQMGPNEVGEILEALGEEIAACGLEDELIALTVVDFLKVVFSQLRKARLEAKGLDAVEEAYKIVSGRLLFITEQAEANGTETGARVARASRMAIDESVLKLERAGMSIPIKATRTGAR